MRLPGTFFTSVLVLASVPEIQAQSSRVASSSASVPTGYGGNLSRAAPVVDLGYAKVQGIANSTLGTNTYWALHYAQPPTGNNRFRAPKPIESSYGAGKVINATAPGSQCVQAVPQWQLGKLAALESSFAGPTIPSSEDCLTLDVIVPRRPKSKRLPVVVQIHGGGYAQGNSQSEDGHFFVQHAQGSIIYVQIQYRLGMYGFLGGAAVQADGDANVGLLDQRLALDWVQRHIAAFGGDASRVTIWGGSAGGGSVTSQLILYGGESSVPFRAAIAEYPWWQPYHDTPVLEGQYRELLNASQCSDLACVRGLSYEALANASAATFTNGYVHGQYGYGDFYFGPYIDGRVLRDLPSQEFKQGHWSKVPLLTDRDAFEGILFTNFSISTAAEVASDLKTLFPAASTTFLARLDELYPASDFTGSYFDDPFFSSVVFAGISAITGLNKTDTNYFKLSALFGDFIITCPTYYIASAAADAGVPVWKLEFRAGLYLHASTAFALLEPTDLTGLASPNNATLSNAMKNYFLAFITELDPNANLDFSNSSRPYWPQYVSDSRAFQILSANTTAIGVRRDEDASARCDFFHGQSYVVRN